MQRLGQHFLKNPQILQKIATSCAPQKNGVVIEIGPGHGELTNLLVEEAEKGGWRVISIEKDARLASSLKAKEGRSFKLYEGDALKLLPQIVNEIPEKTPYWIIGNIPYYITGKLLRTIGELPRKPIETAILIQEEVALRASSTPPHMNRLSASLWYWATPKVLFRVPKGNFSPPPKVESAVLTLLTHKNASDTPYESYFSAVKMLFAQPKKTIYNNLRALLGTQPKKLAIAQKCLEENGVEEGWRPQRLDIKTIEELGSKIFGAKGEGV